MAEVEVTVNGRSYLMGCDDGQEEHLIALAEEVARRVDELVATVGQVGDARLLLMASLLIADELYDTRMDVENFQSRATRQLADIEGNLADRLDLLAQRLEMVAAQLQDS
ncbi:MAG TPA: cell division protein ZapA [Sphingomicrobium sp.]|nr:cell division protein ZapA [Sphingomicrobium sp.]